MPGSRASAPEGECRARRVSAEGVVGTVVDRGEEDDRDVTRALAPLDVRGRLEAVHSRHLDIQQNDREIVRQQRLERFLP